MHTIKRALERARFLSFLSLLYYMKRARALSIYLSSSVISSALFHTSSFSPYLFHLTLNYSFGGSPMIYDLLLVVLVSRHFSGVCLFILLQLLRLTLLLPSNDVGMSLIVAAGLPFHQRRLPTCPAVKCERLMSSSSPRSMNLDGSLLLLSSRTDGVEQD